MKVVKVSRSIMDAYLKKAKFNKEPLLAKFRLLKPLLKPFLGLEPSQRINFFC
ncbi:hypothetical protein HanIR_Chr01g0031381 [Helianthus annuus]|nr:hypothetical protein HanIR_Chr01g0031381 [Helianthus annuus]